MAISCSKQKRSWMQAPVRLRKYSTYPPNRQLSRPPQARADARLLSNKALVMQLDVESVPYKDRKHAVKIALAIVDGMEEEALR
jgi:hypothetical protein